MEPKKKILNKKIMYKIKIFIKILQAMILFYVISVIGFWEIYTPTPFMIRIVLAITLTILILVEEKPHGA